MDFEMSACHEICPTLQAPVLAGLGRPSEVKVTGPVGSGKKAGNDHAGNTGHSGM
jgi:hypothetical protein